MHAFCGRAGFYLGTGALEARHACLFQEPFNEIDCLLCAQHCTADIISSRILSWMDSESDRSNKIQMKTDHRFEKYGGHWESQYKVSVQL